MLRRLSRLSRFSLRGLLMAMTACCVAMAVWSIYVKPFRDQAAANRKLAEINLTSESVSAAGPEWQRWLVETMIGPNAFVHTVRADLRSRPLTADEVSILSGLQFLRELYLDRSQLDSAGAAVVGSLQHLRILSLTYVGLDDDELGSMPAFPALQTLYLTGNPVSRRSAAELCAMPALETLYVRWTALSARDAAELRQAMPRCRVVHHAFE